MSTPNTQNLWVGHLIQQKELWDGEIIQDDSGGRKVITRVFQMQREAGVN